MTYKVKVENVSKVYELNRSRIDKLKSLFSFGAFKKSKPFYALRNINFEVESGDSVGIIGLNGSGKTTMSDLLGEVSEPTTGNIYINGKSRLIAISAGLNSELTGHENIRMKCLMHGMSEQEIDGLYDDIVEFSELGDFISQPIKSYSSGMKSRLGFAIAIHTDPDVLIVDEALSVGDETFSNKCIVRMKDFQKQGKTIFFVSHSAKQVSKMCNKAIWLHYGEMKAFGNVVPVANKYAQFIEKYKKMSKEDQKEYKANMIAEQQKKGEEEVEIKEEKAPFYSYLFPAALFLGFVTMIIEQIGLYSVTEVIKSTLNF
ncbi:ABC transporter ATP-binding protein [Salinicoccus bachuensis]|uniref:ABC transporter ATP-binding protein n=1 Tax=Salinicoccus bachuensis TaxID=3136731 RepID=A0ABZ3CLG1_9STAP